MSMSRLVDLSRLCYVPRWAIVPMVRPQSVAEHSFRVAIIAADLAEAFWPEPEDPEAAAARTEFVARVVWYSLCHDAEEAVTGDIPGNYKRFFKKLLGFDAGDPAKATLLWADEFTDGDVIAIVRLADAIEALTYLGRWSNHNDRIAGIMDRQRTLVAERSCEFSDVVKARVEKVIKELMEDTDGSNYEDHAPGREGGPRDRQIPRTPSAGRNGIRIVERPAPNPGGEAAQGDGGGEGT